MTKRKSLLTVLSGLSMACLAGAFTFLPVNQAKAEETQKTVVENVLMEGAYVRTTGEGNETYNTLSGIRFVMFIDQETYTTAVETYGEENVEVGMYYVGRNIDVGGTIDVTTDEEMQDIKTIPKGARHAVMEAYTDSSAKTESASMAFSVAQLGIPESGYNAQLIANGYLKTTDSEGNETYTWATNPTTRSVAEMASIALFEGATHADLHTFVNAVATEETFKFANEVVETDMYKATDLGLTAPANLKIVWDSSNEEVATFDENGALVKVGEGTTTITATIGNNVREMTLNIVAPNPLIVTEDNYLNIYNPDIASDPKLGLSTMTCVTAGEGEVADFTGDYTGKAMRLPAISNPGYILYSAYTAEELAEISKVYNTVSLWFAVDNIASGTFFIMNTSTSFAAKYHGGNKGYTNETCGNWEKWTISISDYISLLQQDKNGRDYVQLFHAWPNAGDDAPVLEEGKDRMCFYVGNVEFGFSPTITKVDSKSYGNAQYYDGWTSYRSYVANGAGTELADFTGGYTGNATKIKCIGGGSNYLLTNVCTEESLLAAKANGYTHVSVWVAATGIVSGSVGLKAAGNANCSANLMYLWDSTFTFTAENCNTWIKVSVSIDDYKKTLGDIGVRENGTAAEGGYVKKSYSNLMSLVTTGVVGVSATDDNNDKTLGVYFYVGDVEFTFDPTIMKVDATSHVKAQYYDGWTSYRLYVANGEGSEIANFTGDYTGDATKIKLEKKNQANYLLLNPFTEKQLALAESEGYTHVSLWIAANGIAEGAIEFYGPSYGTTVAANIMYTWDSTFKFTADNCGQWVNVTISIEDYKKTLYNRSVRNDNSGALQSYSWLMAAKEGVSVTDVDATDEKATDDIFFYIGDVSLVKIAE